MSIVDAVLATWMGAWSVFLVLAAARTAVEIRRVRVILERGRRSKSTASE